MNELKERSSMKTFFHANACGVCQIYGEKIELKRCSGCKMIAYCSRKHQKNHWPQHKELCRVLSDIRKENGTLYGRHENLENPKVWLHEKMKLIILVELKLGRKLSHSEMEMLHSPRSCEICHEINPEKLNNCNDCPYASFCTRHPKDSKHSVKCKTLKLIFEFNHLIGSLGNYFIPKNDCQSIPKNMSRAIQLYEPVYSSEKIIRSKEMWNFIIADRITRAYTCLYSMEKLSGSKLQKLTIHVVGSSGIEVLTAFYWQDILHHMKHLLELNVVFIGPEVTDTCDKLIFRDNYEVENRRLNFQFVGDLYATFAASKSFEKPNYVIGFNLGIYSCSYATDTWAPSLKVLEKLGCPFSFTSSPARDSKRDQERIDYIFGKKVEIFWAGANPFAGWKPSWHFITNEFFYQNEYLTIYEKLA